ncbi:MAG: hypothetical protein U1E50_13450 [Caulobacteraceae bacterium]
MKSRLLLIGAALAAATAIPAQAGVEADAFTAFKSTCGAGSYANAVAAADAAGWKPSQGKMAAAPGITVTETASRQTTIGGSTVVMIVSNGTAAGGRVAVLSCDLFADHSRSLSGLAETAQAWTEVAPQTKEANEVAFRYAGPSGQRRSVAPAEVNTSLGGEGVTSLSLKQNGAVTHFTLINFRM